MRVTGKVRTVRISLPVLVRTDGTWQVKPEDLSAAVQSALDAKAAGR